MKLEQAARKAIECIVDGEIGKAELALREALAGVDMSPTEQAEQKQMAVLDITYGREPECYATPNAEDLPEGTYRLYAAPVQQAEQEPVAWVRVYEDGGYFIEPNEKLLDLDINTTHDLYTAPVRTKDLTDEEIEAIMVEQGDLRTAAFARAVIAADRRKNK